jgi:hypothetical protein
MDMFRNFCLVKIHKIITNSATTKHRFGILSWFDKTDFLTTNWSMPTSKRPNLQKESVN